MAKHFQPPSDDFLEAANSGDFMPRRHDRSLSLPPPRGPLSYRRSIFGDCYCCIFGQNVSESGDRSPNLPDKDTAAAATEWSWAFSLEELYNGTTMKLKFPITTKNKRGRHVKNKKTLTFTLKPGTKKGTRLTYKERGNEYPELPLPSDLVLIVYEKPHNVFKREGDDLIVTRKVSLKEALTAGSDTGLKVTVATLDGRVRTILIKNNVITPNYEELVRGEGMPVFEDPLKKGNLRIKFEIVFPSRITMEQKYVLEELNF